MKLVMLLYLEEDEGCVTDFAREVDVPVMTRVSVEGTEVAAATPGWYRGLPVTHASRMAIAILPGREAGQLMAAVAGGGGALAARRHPVHAFQLPIEAAATCDTGTRH